MKHLNSNMGLLARSWFCLVELRLYSSKVSVPDVAVHPEVWVAADHP